MQVGLLMVFQNFEDAVTDQVAWERDIELAGLAEPLGFDNLSCVEHHFHNYAMSPDNTHAQVLQWTPRLMQRSVSSAKNRSTRFSQEL